MKYKYKPIQDVMTIDTLKLLIEYNPLTGKLIWKERGDDLIDIIRMTPTGIKHFNKRYAGKVVSARLSPKKYYPTVQMILDGSKMTETQHKIAWAIYYGDWPEVGKVIDHIDRDKCNNRIVNLRLVSQTENLYNANLRDRNTSGTTGVSYKKDKEKWKAYYFRDNKQYHLGYFNTYEEAVKARKDWELRDDLFLSTFKVASQSLQRAL